MILDPIVAAVLIEERFAYLHVGLGAEVAAALAAKPVQEGGLGRSLHPATVKSRARSYERKRAQRLAAAQENERDRLVAAAEDAVVRADKRLGVIAAGADAGGYGAAFRAYEAAEDALERRRTEHVPLARWMRKSDEIDVALELASALRLVPSEDRVALIRSLNLRDPLRAFQSRLTLSRPVATELPTAR